MEIVIAGSSGFIGSRLVPFLREKGHQVSTLSRQPKTGEHLWDPENKVLDSSILEGVDVVINLAGESILGRWNKEKMERIKQSRLHSTQFLCDTLLKLKKPPALYINASAIGYYGDRGNEILTEASAPGKGFLAEVCQQWEGIAATLSQKGVRVVMTRFGLVLGEGGGALEKMEKPFKKGMGGTLGKGDQMMSWIALDDVLNAFQFIIEHEDMAGPVNFVAPHALSNVEFTKIFAHLLGKPAPLPIPKFALSMIFGSGAEVFLSSTHVHPEALLRCGFTFQYPDVEGALKKYLRINS